MVFSLSLSRQRSIPSTSLWRAGLTAALLAVIANLVIYGLARLVDAIPQSVMVNTPTENGPISLIPVVVASILAILVATVFYAVLRRVVARPERAFWIIGIVLLVLSLTMPLSIPDAPLSMVIALSLMHIATGVVALVTLTRLARP